MDGDCFTVLHFLKEWKEEEEEEEEDRLTTGRSGATLPPSIPVLRDEEGVI